MDDVWHVVEAVWESLLGVWPAAAEPVDVAEDWLCAVVTVDGDWRGAVSLSCSPGTAQHMARTMLDVAGDEPDPGREDVEDALREVVNVIGGNVKALVPGGRALGLPVLVVGRPDLAGDLAGDPAGELHVGWPGHQARVAVWRSASPAPDTEPAHAAKTAGSTHPISTNHQHTEQ
jgi:chemotaxis protein CheX